MNNITIYMAPYGDSSLGTPGVDAGGVANTIFNNAADTLIAFLMDKTPATTTVTVLPPAYVPINISLTLNILPQYRQATVSDAVYAILQSLLDFDNVIFAEEFVLQYVLSAISSISGVSYADVTLITRNDATFTGNIAASSATISNVSSFTNLAVGQKIAVTGGTVTIPVGTTISSMNTGASTITLSANCGGSSTTSGAALSVIGVNSIVCATNEIPKAGTITITPVGGITI